MRSIPVFVPLLLVGLVLGFPRSAGAADEFPVTVHERVLGNGLKVLVVPRKGVPHAACALTYDVGSVNERVGHTGMAHYLEHMMFKGTERMGVKDLELDARLRDALDGVLAETIRLEDGAQTDGAQARLEALRTERARLIEEQKQNLEVNHLFTIFREAGSTFTNAMTSEDGTTYIAALPPEKVELFFWVEADRLQNCVFRQFHAEKDVVREERRMYENRPGALFREAVQSAIFGSHPYAHPVLGYHEDLRNLTRAELREFFSTYYAPDNAVLFVSGDVAPERIFALAERYFGPVSPGSAKRPRVPVLRIPRSGEVRLEGEGRGRSALNLYFRVPAAGTEAALGLDLLAMHLGDEDGALYRALVEDEKVAISLGADYDARKYGGVLEIRAPLSPSGTHAAVEKRIWEAIEALRTEPLTDEAMTDLRRRYRARVLSAAQSDMRMGFMILRRELTGSWRDIDRDLARVKTLPASAIQAAAEAYLVRENAVATEYAKNEEAIGLGAAPAPLPAHLGERANAPTTEDPALGADLPSSWKDLTFEERAFELPSGEKARRELANGIRAFVVPNVGEPAIRIAVRVLGGAAEDPAGKEGLSEIAASVLGEAGVEGLSPEALKEHLEGLVASVETSSGLHAHDVTLSVFPADLDEGLRILRLLLSDPQLDPSAFARIKSAKLSRIDGQDTRLGGVTRRLYRDLLWGKVPETRRPTRESVESITLDDVRAALASKTGPARILLAVSGDVDLDEMTARLDGALGDWMPESIPAHERLSTRNDPAVAAQGLHVRPMPASQGSVRIGVPTVPATHEDAAALRVLASVLARRTFNSVRSVHGLAYQASARFTPSWRNDSPFTVMFQTKCESVPFAIDLACKEIAKLREEGPTPKEVADAQQGLEAGFRRTFGRGFDAAEVFADLATQGVALDHHERLRRAYAAVDPSAVQAVAVRYLTPERLLLLCVGDVDAMRAGDGRNPQTLADLGEMTTHAAPVAVDEGAPDGVVRQVLAALHEGDGEAVKAHATEAMRTRLEEAPDAGQRLAMMSRMLKTAQVSDPEVTVEGSTARARVRIEAKFGEQALVLVARMGLLKEGEAWKLDSLQVDPGGGR